LRQKQKQRAFPLIQDKSEMLEGRTGKFQSLLSKEILANAFIWFSRQFFYEWFLKKRPFLSGRDGGEMPSGEGFCTFAPTA